MNDEKKKKIKEEEIIMLEEEYLLREIIFRNTIFCRRNNKTKLTLQNPICCFSFPSFFFFASKQKLYNMTLVLMYLQKFIVKNRTYYL